MRVSWKNALVLIAVLFLNSSVIASAAEDGDIQMQQEDISLTEQSGESYNSGFGDEDISDDNTVVYQKGWNGSIEENNRCYVDFAGNKLTGLNCIDEKWYYFDENGYLLTGWQTIDEKTYYFSLETGERYENDTFLIEDEEYVFDENGILISYSDENAGQEESIPIVDDSANNQTFDQNEITLGSNDTLTDYEGWQLSSEGYYYYDSEGNKVTGWLQLGNSWYYLDGSNAEYPGLMSVDCKKEINGYTYFFGSDGRMQTGWISRPEGKYYAYAGGNQKFGWLQL